MNPEFKKYFATVKLTDGRIAVMNNNQFLAKSFELAEKRAEKLYPEGEFEVLKITEVK